MLDIVETLGVGWGVGNLVYDYLMGKAWWAWAIDAGFIIAGVVTGGLIAAIKTAGHLTLKTIIRGLGRQRGVAL